MSSFYLIGEALIATFIFFRQRRRFLRQSASNNQRAPSRLPSPTVPAVAAVKKQTSIDMFQHGSTISSAHSEDTSNQNDDSAHQSGLTDTSVLHDSASHSESFAPNDVSADNDTSAEHDSTDSDSDTSMEADGNSVVFYSTSHVESDAAMPTINAPSGRVSPIASLPVELLLLIATEYCPLSAGNLNTLSRTCRGFYNLLNPILYDLNVERMGSSAAMHAARHGHIETLERLAVHGADFAAIKDEDGWEFGPVGVAARHGQEEVLTWFLQRLDFQKAPLVLHGALFEAVTGGHVLACRVLLQHGVKLRFHGRAEKELLVADALRQGKPYVLEALAECLSEEEVESLIWDVDHPKEAAEANERAAQLLERGQAECWSVVSVGGW